MNKGQPCNRNDNGNMLALIGAFALIIIALILLCLGYVRFVGSNSEQRTAVESAAIAAARDCSRIVINSDECGYVSLSDYAPNGAATIAGDGFPLPVRSINTIIGTARLDLIIADKLGQPIMEDLAKQDLDNAMLAKDLLVTALTDAIQPGGTGQDKDGNSVTPYASAETAYQQNQIRMTGHSGYVANSLQLSLGSLEGGSLTAIPIPQPTDQAPVPASMRIGNFYKSYTNIPYKSVDFVFGGISDSIRIVDNKLWKATIADLPYQIPTIIRAEAKENLDPNNSYTTTVVACAQPATVFDPLPAPGALSISLPDGPVPEITRPIDLYTHAKMSGGGGSSSATMLTAKNGDYPMDAGSHMAAMKWPLDGSIGPRQPSEVWRVALHDWIRRGGTKANISSVVNMQTTVLDAPTPPTFTWVGPINYSGVYHALGTIPSGIIHIFKFASDGAVIYLSKPLTPTPLYASSHEQMHGEAMGGINASTIGNSLLNLPPPGGKLTLMSEWDIYFRDEVRQPGSALGGKHAGEPVAKPIVAIAEPKPGRLLTQFMPTYHAKVFPSVFGDAGPGPGPGGGDYPNPNPPCGGDDLGFPPMVQARNDFGRVYNPAATVLATMPGGSGPVRPFYATTGTAVDIRFRRLVDVSEMPGATSDYGYVYEVAPP